MAVAEIMNSQLRLVLVDGADELTGEPIYKFKSFSNVKTNADADQLHAVGEAFAGLQERELESLERKDSLSIMG
jgi:hypothetical protein